MTDHQIYLMNGFKVLQMKNKRFKEDMLKHFTWQELADTPETKVMAIMKVMALNGNGPTAAKKLVEEYIESKKQ